MHACWYLWKQLRNTILQEHYQEYDLKKFSENRAGADPGGGGLGGQEPPPPFWGTPKLHKVGKNVVRLRTNTLHFSS